MGQAHGKTQQRGPAPGEGHPSPFGVQIPTSPRSGSPSIPGSPVTYSPQLQMEPLASAGSAGEPGGSLFGHTEFAGWAAQPKLVPTVLVWAHGGSQVELEGSFDAWRQRHAMQRSGRDFTLVKLLPPGVFQYKFIVDGAWRHDPNLPSVYDDMGNINNVLEVQEYVPENLDGLSGFDPPPSPPSSYASLPPAPEDFLKEPPLMPPQLQLSLLNVPPAMDGIAALPRPQHVVLNHVYMQRSGAGGTGAAVLGTTHRYRNKYVTTVLYKPKEKGSTGSGGDQNGRGRAMPAASDASMGGGTVASPRGGATSQLTAMLH